MFGKSFTYDGHSSDEYNLVMASFEEDEMSTGLEREVIKGEMNMYRNIPNHLGTKYTDTLTFKVSVMKDICKFPNQEDSFFTEDEVDEINAWLTSSNYPLLFHMYNYDNEKYNSKQYDYFGIFTNVETEMVGDKIAVLIYTFTTNSPFAWTNLIEQTMECKDTTIFTFNVKNSERYMPLYPVIIIDPDDDGLGKIEITIEGNSDSDRTLKLSLLKNPITIDCSKRKIYDDLGLLTFEDLNIKDIDYIYWPRLWNGENQFTITGNAKITFQYREVRKVGAY